MIKTQNYGQAGSRWMGNQETDVVSLMSEKKWLHRKNFLYCSLRCFMHGYQNRQTERKGKKMIKMFSFSCIGKQSFTSAWIINCVSLIQVMY